MTTPEAAARYLEEHKKILEGKKIAVYNPNGRTEDLLPVIYGLNNGGHPGWWTGVLLAEDGTCLGQHICSDEGYMLNDLGILEGCRPDRHEQFRAHYPNGYRMEFVSYDAARDHVGLNKAIALNQQKRVEAERATGQA